MKKAAMPMKKDMPRGMPPKGMPPKDMPMKKHMMPDGEMMMGKEHKGPMKKKGKY